MTAKRDPKRRVRPPQASPGKTDLTAQRRVATAGRDPCDPGDAAGSDVPGARDGRAPEPTGTAPPGTAAAVVPGGPADAAPDAAAVGTGADAVEVVEVIDVTAQARGFGFLCPVLMFPSLVDRIEPAVALAQLRELLLVTPGDPQLLALSQLALSGVAPDLRTRPPTAEFLRWLIGRARAGMGGVLEDGAMLLFHAAGRRGIVPILCGIGGRHASLQLSAIDDRTGEAGGLEHRLAPLWRRIPSRRPQRAAVAGGHARVAAAPTLFVICDRQRHAITRDEFLIGRTGRDAHLAIEDDRVSRHHAAVVHRDGVHYLQDLGSAHGVIHQGLRIDHKRILEGDVFQIGDHELRFTYRSDDDAGGDPDR